MSDASTDQPSGPAGGNSVRLNSIIAAKALREGFAWLTKPPYSFSFVEASSENDHNGFGWSRVLYRGEHSDVFLTWHALQSQFGMVVYAHVPHKRTSEDILATDIELMKLENSHWEGPYVEHLDELSMLCEVASAALRRHPGLLDARCAEVAQSITDRLNAILPKQTD